MLENMRIFVPEKVLIYTCSFSKNCHDNCDVSCFKIIDNATSFHQLKIKESFHIERLKPELNKQVDHVSLALHF